MADQPDRPSNRKKPSPHNDLSSAGARRALTYVRDVAKGRKDVVSFYWDEKAGTVRELGTGKAIEVIGRQSGSESGGDP